MKNLMMCLMVIGCSCVAMNAMDTRPYITDVCLGDKVVRITSSYTLRELEQVAKLNGLTMDALLKQLAEDELRKPVEQRVDSLC